MLPQQKTYWHLVPLKRMPTEYEIVSSRLLYHLEKGFEVNLPLQAWHDRYQKGSPLRCSDWEKFYDPRETTYTKYTKIQTVKEILVDELLESIEDTGYDQTLSEEWLRTLDRVLAPMRYPWHGFQMIACYLGQMGPSGRIAIAGMFQAADEIRRIQRVAYRMRQLQLSHPGFREGSRATWQNDPIWQPLRETVERLLVTYDWGECFVGLNLVVKPMVDRLFMLEFGRLARGEADDTLYRMLSSLEVDCQWHRAWSRALARTALDDRPENRTVIEGWIERWRPMAHRAAAAFAPLFDAMPENPAGRLADVEGSVLDLSTLELD